jgi:hypothetical protein
MALLRQGLAGALGGLLVFALLEQRMLASESRLIDETAELQNALVHFFLLGIVFGGVVTGFLTAANELPTGRPLRILAGAAAGMLIGAVIGTLFSVAANFLYDALHVLALFGGRIAQVLARTAGWSLFGVGVGLSAGALSRSGRRIAQGCLGGLIGGFIGGFLFDALAEATEGGTVSRLVGFVALGACVGVATALVEQLAKVAWITFLSGSREGRQVVLHRDWNALGRDELAEIPLFGDPAVERRHAVLALAPAPLITEVAQALLLRVNGSPVREALLQDGSLVEIGKHRFRFHHRQLPAAAPPLVEGLPRSPWTSPPALGGPATVAVPLPAELPPPPGATDAWSADPALLLPPGGRLLLRVVSGPGAGQSVPLASGIVTLGREVGNTLIITDPRISRYHLRIDSREGAWVLKDLESTNGTRLNGLRVTRAGLAPGDRITVGDTVLAVEADGTP